MISTHIRDPKLLDASTPSIPIFQSLYSHFHLKDRNSSALNVQANSPNIELSTLRKAANIMNFSDTNELLSIYSSDRKNNGSLWGFSSFRLVNYGDPYLHLPDSFVTDDSVDIHTQQDFDKSLAQVNHKK